MIEPAAGRPRARPHNLPRARRARLLTVGALAAAVLTGAATTATATGPFLGPRPSPTPTETAPVPSAPILPPLPSAPPAPAPPGGVAMGGPRLTEPGTIVDPAAGPPPDVSAPSFV